MLAVIDGMLFAINVRLLFHQTFRRQWFCFFIILWSNLALNEHHQLPMHCHDVIVWKEYSVF